MPVRWLLSWNSPSWLYNSLILSTIHFPSIEICWHWVYAPLVHIKLVYFNRIPIIKVILRVCRVKTINISICMWTLTNTSLFQIWGFPTLLSHGSSHWPRWIKKALTSFFKLTVCSIKISQISFILLRYFLFKELVLSTEFIDLNILFVYDPILILELFSKLLITFE